LQSQSAARVLLSGSRAQHKDAAQKNRDAEVVLAVEIVRLASRYGRYGRYGYRRIRQMLVDEDGASASRRVYRTWQHRRLEACQVRPVSTRLCP
jgi:hypothetical protein